MADLVDRLEQPARDVPGLRALLMGPSVLDGVPGAAPFFPGVPGVSQLGPLAPDTFEDRILDENVQLREEVRELRLHLEMAHDCHFPQGEGDG
jgi:hypothetical protein